MTQSRSLGDGARKTRTKEVAWRDEIFTKDAGRNKIVLQQPLAAAGVWSVEVPVRLQGKEELVLLLQPDGNDPVN